MVDLDPGGSARSVEEGVEQRPVGNRVRAVSHGFRFAVGAGDRAGVQMIAADHDRTLELARGDHFVELQADPVAVAERSEEHTSELQSLMRISYAVFCLKKKKKKNDNR